MYFEDWTGMNLDETWMRDDRSNKGNYDTSQVQFNLFWRRSSSPRFTRKNWSSRWFTGRRLRSSRFKSPSVASPSFASPHVTSQVYSSPVQSSIYAIAGNVKESGLGYLIPPDLVVRVTIHLGTRGSWLILALNDPDLGTWKLHLHSRKMSPQKHEVG